MMKIEFQVKTTRASIDMTEAVTDYSITDTRLIVKFDHWKLPPNAMDLMFALGGQNIRMIDMGSTISLVVKPLELQRLAALDVVRYEILARCEI